MKNLKTILIVLLVVIALAVTWFIYSWNSQTLEPNPQALVELTSDGFVTVTEGDWIIFEPFSGSPTTGFIFYPGARVDPRAYAPVLRAIASEGHLVVVTPMPLNMAALAPNAADEVIATYPAIEHWIVGGHSLGGVIAAQYAASHQDKVAGLVLWAAYPADNNNLSKSSLKVLSIYGSLDMAGPEPYEASRALLPADTTWFVIQGGNHAQFGDYGPQPGDKEATIPETFQWLRIVEHTGDFLLTFK